MKTISIKGSVRTDLGKKATKKLRKNNLIPCIIYGEKKDANGATVTTHFCVTNSEVRNLIYTPDIFLVNLEIDGTESKCILKEIQFHPVTDKILHIDFYKVVEEVPIVMAVPVAPQGLALGVRKGGKLNVQVRKIKVRAKYDLIPEKLNIDVTNLDLSKTIKVGELSFENLEIVTPKDVVICAVITSRAAQSDVATTTDAAPATAAPAAAAEK